MGSPAENIASVQCEPGSNCNLLQYSILRIAVRVNHRQPGATGSCRVVIRTNLNQAHRIRRQIIDLVERGQSYSTDYYDIPATYDPQTDAWTIEILLSEVGYFEFKARVESAEPTKPWVRWSDGPNTGITVTPLDYARNNSIYCAFIRQYTDKKHLPDLKDEVLEESIKELEDQGAYVIPPGGNFLNFMSELPFIIQDMGMKIIHLLPINPVPVAYGRMGMYGSPYATTDYFGIDHTYAKFSRYKTIEDQFIDLTSTIHGLGAKVFLDMVINHSGWASTVHFTHRHWRKVGKDKKIVSPGAWGVVWGDLVELDYRHKDLWQYMAGMFLAWCQRGIDGFRLDAGYMVPLEVWRYIIAKVREEFPNTLFLLEGLGGPWATTELLLTEGQMNWAYSELFQNYSRGQIVDYLGYAQRVSAQKGVLIHYAETHDNDRLAKKGKAYARMRVYLCALTSFSGAWGFTNGVEWLATEKIDVHRNMGLNWGSEDNLVSDIARLNHILSENPAFWYADNMRVIDAHHGDILAFVRSDENDSNVVLCLINLNVEQESYFRVDFKSVLPEKSRGPEAILRDMVSDTFREMPAGEVLEGVLSPGDCLVYRMQKTAQPYSPRIPSLFGLDYDQISLIYRILLERFKPYEVGQIDQEKLLTQVRDYRKFIALVNTVRLNRLIKGDIAEAMAEINPETIDLYCAIWTFRESSREFIISGDKWLMVHTFVPCTAYLRTSNDSLTMESIPCPDGLGHLTFFPPCPANETAFLTFNWKIQHGSMIQRQWQGQEYPILYVPSGKRKARMQRKVYPLELEKPGMQNREYPTVLLTNGRGIISQCPAMPGILNSKYDTIFAISPDTDSPTERVSLGRMVRETVQVGQKYFDLDGSFVTKFTRYPQPMWEFVYDDGEYYLRIERWMIMAHDENTLYLRYKLVEANTPIVFIVKSYIECRSPHNNLSANDMRQSDYGRSCRRMEGQVGYQFTPMPNVTLSVLARRGDFLAEPHWLKGESIKQDAERGLADHTDAYSPGIFTAELHRSESQVITLTADALAGANLSTHRAMTAESKRLKDLASQVSAVGARKDNYVRMLIGALDQFIVKTKRGYQLVGGYPWLPVGTRQALHCVGGLLAAGREDVARDVILQSAGTVKDGMVGDWISGAEQGWTNVEGTLRLFLAASEYVRHTENDSIWDATAGLDKCLRSVLVEMFEVLSQSYVAGEKPRVSLDDDSGLLYSPPGGTWMNTTYPQSTPRGGYSVEIQALWYEALAVIAELSGAHTEKAEGIREKLRQKFMPLFWNQPRGHLADVLLANPALPVGRALVDTSLRFNQLAAIKYGLVSREQARQIVDGIARHLLIPGGIRSLAEEPVTVPLRITGENGVLLNDPRMPYCGICTGDETARRMAYHNGTAWPSAFPDFIEARAAVFGYSHLAVKQALAFFEPVWSHLNTSGIGTLSEMLDGSYPHISRGCYAYSVAVAETLRVYIELKYRQNHHGEHAVVLSTEDLSL